MTLGGIAMHALFDQAFDAVILVMEGAGVAVIVGGALLSALRYLRHPEAAGAYRQVRATMGRGVLLGLELLLAADIIRTVVMEPSLEGILLLAAIVLVRTFLSVSIEVEIEGRWPWNRASSAAVSPPREHGMRD
jgi:uncharacterized membrane protein